MKLKTKAEHSIADHPYLKGYTSVSGVADELFDADGQMRRVWRPFVKQFTHYTRDEVDGRFARGNQYLRDAGVYYRQYSNDPMQEREWPLSHVPVILHETEWDSICAALEQRAELLELVCADLYGEARLVKEGHLPPELVAGNKHWLRPMVGVRPRGGHFLHMIAFEIGRSPDGSWFVLGDRTQAPSGAGFALENRIATGRVFPEAFRASNIHRLAEFFLEFRSNLREMAGDGGGVHERAGILTPGMANDAYYEHTYIARYLGLPLLEGEDLIVRDGQLMVRTIEGPQPIGVLWRRIDANFADPLELDPTSHIGTPGLVEAVRSGTLAMVNALGSGVLETRAMMAFMPRISQVLMGQPLAMPNIATWWCGGAQERAYVRANKDRMTIGPSLSVELPFDLVGEAAIGGRFRGTGSGSVDDWLEARAGALVGQEAVTLSTTPVWRDGCVSPAPVSVRVFAARTPTGWIFMKGGYARVGREGDVTALSMQSGGAVADVWIVSDDTVPDLSLTSTAPGEIRRQERGALPARAADNLFWLGRYVERCQDAIRFIRAYHLRLAETGTTKDPRLERIEEFMDRFGYDLSEPIPKALLGRFEAASQCAAKVRDRFSTDGWLALRDLSQTAYGMTRTAEAGDDTARAMGVLLRKITGFAGLVHENMYRSEAWAFLSIGRAIERSDGILTMLSVFGAPKLPAGTHALAVEVADSVISHRRRFQQEVSQTTLIDLVALDPDNPRALLFEINALIDLVERLPKGRVAGRPGAVLAHLVPLRARLEVAKPADVTPEVLAEFRSMLFAASDALSATYLR